MSEPEDDITDLDIQASAAGAAWAKLSAEFKPDYTPEQLENLGVYDALYRGQGPRLASLGEWKPEWVSEHDPKGWAQWYKRYTSGRRIPEEDERQIKRWASFKARHGSSFTKNPTPRRGWALRNWGIDPAKLVPNEARNGVVEMLDAYQRKAMQKHVAEKQAEQRTFYHGSIMPGLTTLKATQPNMGGAGVYGADNINWAALYALAKDRKGMAVVGGANPKLLIHKDNELLPESTVYEYASDKYTPPPETDPNLGWAVPHDVTPTKTHTVKLKDHMHNIEQFADKEALRKRFAELIGKHTKQAEDKQTAVIIRGNPKFITDNPAAEDFYGNLQKHMEQQGYSVTQDAGEPHTTPAAANVWLGHSRGVDRFRFAPEGTRTIGLGAPDGINHPDDTAMKPGDVPTAAHYKLTPEMLAALSVKLQKQAEQRTFYHGSIMPGLTTLKAMQPSRPTHVKGVYGADNLNWAALYALAKDHRGMAVVGGATPKLLIHKDKELLPESHVYEYASDKYTPPPESDPNIGWAVPHDVTPTKAHIVKLVDHMKNIEQFADKESLRKRFGELIGKSEKNAAETAMGGTTPATPSAPKLSTPTTTPTKNPFTNQHIRNGGQPQFSATENFQHMQQPKMPDSTFDKAQGGNFGANAWAHNNYAAGAAGMAPNRTQFYSNINSHIQQQPGATQAYTQHLDQQFNNQLQTNFSRVQSPQIMRNKYLGYINAERGAVNPKYRQEMMDDATQGTAKTPPLETTTPEMLGDTSAANAGKTRFKIPIRLDEPTGPLDKATFSHSGVVNLPKGQDYFGQGQGEGGKDLHSWGPAMPRSLVGLHELAGHGTQIAADDADEKAFFNAMPPDAMHLNVAGPHGAFHEPAAVLTEQIHAINAANAATGQAPDFNVQLSPNYAPSARWMADQAKRHGFTSGHRAMQDLLNTPEGQAWLQHQHRDYYETQKAEREKQNSAVQQFCRRVKKSALLPEVNLQPHQERIQETALEENPRMLVYHGLGSGKSLSAIAAAEAAKQKYNDDYGIVAPASLRGNFQKEVEKFTEDSKPEILSYTGLGLGKDFKKQPDTVIMDEAHRLRNPGGSAAQAAKTVADRAKRVLLLTGSPITNSPSDLANLISIVARQNITPNDFEKKFVGQKTVHPGIFNYLAGVKPGVRPVIKNEGELRKLLEGRVDYQPSKTPEGVNVNEEKIQVPLTSAQQKIQKALRTNIPPSFLWKLDKEFPLSKDELSKLNSFLTGLRQNSVSTRPFRQDSDALSAFNQSGKLQEAYKRLNELIESDPRKKAIIYSNHIGAGIEPYAAALDKNRIPYGVFHGGIPTRVRQQSLKDYNEGKLRALLIGPAGAEGLSTKGTNLIQLLDPHWHESRTQQARGRGLRFDSHDDLPEELKNVAVQRFISKSEEPSFLGKLMGYRRERTGDEILERLSNEKEVFNERFRDLLREIGSRNHKEEPKTAAYEFGKAAGSSPAWQRAAGKNEEGGLNAKGRASYNKATGGNLKAPVTEKNPKGKAKARQNSFCSRMCGMKSKNTGSEAKSDPDSRINKSLRKWNCKCSADLLAFGKEAGFRWYKRFPVNDHMAVNMSLGGPSVTFKKLIPGTSFTLGNRAPRLYVGTPVPGVAYQQYLSPKKHKITAEKEFKDSPEDEKDQRTTYEKIRDFLFGSEYGPDAE